MSVQLPCKQATHNNLESLTAHPQTEAQLGISHVMLHVSYLVADCR